MISCNTCSALCLTGHSDISSLETSTALNRATPRHPAPRRSNGTIHSGRLADGDNWDQRLGFLMHDVSRLRRSGLRRIHEARRRHPVAMVGPRAPVAPRRHDPEQPRRSAGTRQGCVGRPRRPARGRRLHRASAGPADRRVKRIHLTPKGTRMVLKMREQSDAMSERILTGLTLAAPRLTACSTGQAQPGQYEQPASRSSNQSEEYDVMDFNLSEDQLAIRVGGGRDLQSRSTTSTGLAQRSRRRVPGGFLSRHRRRRLARHRDADASTAAPASGSARPP